MRCREARSPLTGACRALGAAAVSLPDPLPEAGLRKAKRKYRNECVENLHRPRGWGVGGREGE